MTPDWQVGYVQNGPLHDAGLRCIVVRRHRGKPEGVAWTANEEDAQKIVDALIAVKAT